MKNSKKSVRILNIICSVLLLALLVLQCLPFWSMPTCDACEVRCELEIDEDCEACKSNPNWCAVPTSCICEYKCPNRKGNEACPICFEDEGLCVAVDPIPETEPTEPVEVPTEATEPEVTEPEVTEPVEDVEATEPEEVTEDVEATEPEVVTEDVEATEPEEVTEDVEATEPAEEPEATEPEATEPEPTEPEPTAPPLVPTAPIPEEREVVDIAIQEYVWMPTLERCDGVTEYFSVVYGDDFTMNNIVLMPVAVLLLTLVGVVVCILKSDKPWVALFALAAGAVAVFGYLTMPIFQLSTMWQIHLGVAAAMVAAALAQCVLAVVNLLKSKKN